MEESKQHQLFLQMQQQQQTQQRQQQFSLMQHLQRQQQQHAAMTRFPSNTNSYLAPPGLIQNRPVNPYFQNSNLNPNVQQQQQQQRPMMMMMPQQQQEQKKPLNQMELQFAYQDAWRVCHPDFKRPFTSLEDACERLLPYHVVADYEAEEDDMILHSDTTHTTSKTVSRSQQWDDSIAAKVAAFTDAFEKQVQAFNTITQKRKDGELRSEERFLVEQFLLMEERKACTEVKTELDREMKAHEARLRMAAMAQAGQVMSHNPMRGNNAFGNYGEQQQQQGRYMNPDEMMMRMRSWMNSNNSVNSQREEKEPVEDFLNDEETGQHDNWRGNGGFDLNTR